jgi:hypothetical protein
MTVDAPLVCPGCGAGGAPSERFCTRCGSPLVIAPAPDGPRLAEPPDPDSARARARKVHPPYAEGELVVVAAARHQAEAEMLQALLLDAGVPSLVRRSGGFDVPDFLAAGPRDVLVPRGGEAVAREALGRDAESPRAGDGRAPAWVRAMAVALAVLVVAVVAAGVFAAVFS